MKNFISLSVGFIFAIGLGVGGMTQPHIVRGFLDILGEWDWRLMGVMVGAIGVHFVTFRLIMKRKAPILAKDFQVPQKKSVDSNLIIGSILFGLGWGWTGICPGPGIVALISGQSAFMVFVGSMITGMILFQLLQKKFKF